MGVSIEPEGIRRVWVQGGEEINILTRWRFVRQLSWSPETEEYAAKLWIRVAKVDGKMTRTWIDYDTAEEASNAFEQAVELYYRDTGEDIDVSHNPSGGGMRTCWLEPLTPSQRRARAAQGAREAKDDWTPPPSESLGEPPDYDPNDNPF